MINTTKPTCQSVSGDKRDTKSSAVCVTCYSDCCRRPNVFDKLVQGGNLVPSLAGRILHISGTGGGG